MARLIVCLHKGLPYALEFLTRRYDEHELVVLVTGCEDEEVSLPSKGKRMFINGNGSLAGKILPSKEDVCVLDGANYAQTWFIARYSENGKACSVVHTECGGDLGTFPMVS